MTLSRLKSVVGSLLWQHTQLQQRMASASTSSLSYSCTKLYADVAGHPQCSNDVTKQGKGEYSSQ